MTNRINDLLLKYNEGKEYITIVIGEIDDAELIVEIEESVITQIDFHIDLLENVLNGNTIIEENILKAYNLSEVYYNLVVTKILTDLNK